MRLLFPAKYAGADSSLPQRKAGRYDGAGREPTIIRLELHAENVVANPQVTIAATQHRFGHHGLNFLCDHTDVGLVAAIVAEAIEAEAVVEPAEQRDVVLEQHVGMASAAFPTALPAAATPTARPSAA